MKVITEAPEAGQLTTEALDDPCRLATETSESSPPWIPEAGLGVLDG